MFQTYVAQQYIVSLGFMSIINVILSTSLTVLFRFFTQIDDTFQDLQALAHPWAHTTVLPCLWEMLSQKFYECDCICCCSLNVYIVFFNHLCQLTFNLRPIIT